MENSVDAAAARVLILGVGEFTGELTNAFSALGAHVHVEEDPQDVRALCDEFDPDYILPLSAIAGLEQLQGLVPSVGALEFSFSREQMLRLARKKLGLPIPMCEVASSFAEFEVAIGQVGYPCVVKPSTHTTGRGYVVVSSESEVAAAWQGQRVVVESVCGQQVVLLVARSIDPATGKLATWFCEPIGVEDTRAWQPIALSAQALENARSVAARVSNALGGRGVIGVELYVSGDDVYFSGAATQPHDRAVVTLASQRFSQFELHARAILGLPLDTTLISPGASVSVARRGQVSYHAAVGALSVPESDIRVFPSVTVALSTAETTAQASAQARLSAQSL
ncbi:ATP-grasp domain-containing protein [Corynebacterium sp. sy039]|uniref:ATP-grasp domain-containing protein n=1 Tax=Corynebacterium sp. sy039 TaxID=2599641 RepID=UPI0011B409E1|nr:ATP-grasp domain-containing protein [Corynebacterium sp. sy039]QDZ41872.1 ATP-grasp domain-containing protein [Corynebacterium sp. sy039]